jgi:hypothetical protein
MCFCCWCSSESFSLNLKIRTWQKINQIYLVINHELVELKKLKKTKAMV